MKDTFNTLPQLNKQFKSEESCREYLAHKRWGDKPACPYCGAMDKVWTIEGGKRYKCSAKECGKKFSVTVGTIFEDTKIKLSIWFQAIYLITTSKKGVSSVQLANQLGITQKTAWTINHKIREMLKDKSEIILNNTVEIDETYVGGKTHNKHRKERRLLNQRGTGAVNKTPVFGMLQRDGNVIASVVQNPRGETLKPIIYKTIEPETLIITDGFGAYSGLNKLYTHEVVNHEDGEYGRGDMHTNSIEGFWSIFKRGIYGIYHSVSPKHLDRYIAEFAGRYNTRKISNHDRFDYVLFNSEGNLTYKSLTAKKD